MDEKKKSSVPLSLDNFVQRYSSKVAPFNKDKHDRDTRFKITRMYLLGFFLLIIFVFIFCGIYNDVIARINIDIIKSSNEQIPYLDISNTVSIITTTLSSGIGFLIGYYFKDKSE